MLFILWIVQATQVAIISFIAKAIGSQSDSKETMKSLTYMLAAFFWPFPSIHSSLLRVVLAIPEEELSTLFHESNSSFHHGICFIK